MRKEPRDIDSQFDQLQVSVDQLRQAWRLTQEAERRAFLDGTRERDASSAIGRLSEYQRNRTGSRV